MLCNIIIITLGGKLQIYAGHQSFFVKRHRICTFYLNCLKDKDNIFFDFNTRFESLKSSYKYLNRFEL